MSRDFLLIHHDLKCLLSKMWLESEVASIGSGVSALGSQLSGRCGVKGCGAFRRKQLLEAGP